MRLPRTAEQQVGLAESLRIALDLELQTLRPVHPVLPSHHVAAALQVVEIDVVREPRRLLGPASLRCELIRQTLGQSEPNDFRS